ncbi:MAG: class I SAM-dependent methyltransferase [Pseudomonadota bacterium]
MTTTLELSGVPETMLWPLWNRAAEARRSDRLIDDPRSIELVDAIDYDFKANFGSPNRGHGIRSRRADDLLRAFLERHGERTSVVALGEGLETQYWRVGEPDVPWFSVDLPEAISARKQCLPLPETMTCISASALDDNWMDALPAGSVPFVSALGLLMYFEEAEVRSLLTRIAARFPDAEVFFDAITPTMSRRTLVGLKVTRSYTAPPMPWGITTDDLPAFIESIPGLEPLGIETYADPYPWVMRPYLLLKRIGPIRRLLAPSLAHARVATGGRDHTAHDTA